MRTKEEIQKIYECWKDGLTQHKTAETTGIPRGTVKDHYKKFSLGVYPNWQQGGDLKSSDESPCGFESHHAYHYAYLFGLYLGDGCISIAKNLKNGKTVYKFRVFQDEKYPNLIEKHMESMRQLFPTNKINKAKKQGCWEIYFYNTSLKKLFPQLGPGMKHNRKIELADWQKKIIEANPKAFISGLFESDGCRYQSKKNNKYEYLFIDFSNKSEDIHELWKWACSLIGVKTRRHGIDKRQSTARTRKDVQILAEFCLEKT